MIKKSFREASHSHNHSPTPTHSHSNSHSHASYYLVIGGGSPPPYKYMVKYRAVAVAVAVSGGGAVAVAVAGLTKRFLDQRLGLHKSWFVFLWIRFGICFKEFVKKTQSGQFKNGRDCRVWKGLRTNQKFYKVLYLSLSEKKTWGKSLKRLLAKV